MTSMHPTSIGIVGITQNTAPLIARQTTEVLAIRTGTSYSQRTEMACLRSQPPPRTADDAYHDPIGEVGLRERSLDFRLLVKIWRSSGIDLPIPTSLA
jgi:hypothetical protein